MFYLMVLIVLIIVFAIEYRRNIHIYAKSNKEIRINRKTKILIGKNNLCALFYDGEFITVVEMYRKYLFMSYILMNDKCYFSNNILANLKQIPLESISERVLSTATELK